MSAKNRALS